MTINKRSKKVMIVVNQVSFRQAMKGKCKGGAPWSVRTKKAGLGDSFLSNGAYKYAKEHLDDDSMILSYVDKDRYEGVCELFGLNPADYSEEWVKLYGEKKEQATVTGTSDEVLKKLEELDKHLEENTRAVEKVGNLLLQVLEKMQQKKPIANAPANNVKQ